MRVLVVSSRWDLVGGAERYAGEVLRELEERGVGVSLLCATGNGVARADLQICAGLGKPRLERAERAQLRAASAACDATLVLSWISNAALAALLDGPPLVRYVQDHTLFCPGLNKLRADGSACHEALGLACLKHYWLGSGCCGQKSDGQRALWRPVRSLARALGEIELLRRAHRVLVASDYMRDEVVGAGLAVSSVEVLPYFTHSATDALPAQDLAPATAEFWSDEPGAPTTKLFAAARLVLPDKGIDYLLSALGQLPERIKLVIAGEGPARGWLEQKVRNEGLAGRVLFTGWNSSAQIEAHYAAADCIVFPSVWDEPFGLVGIEAMAHAKPVVAFDVGGVRQWMLPGESGLLVARRDAAGLAEAIEYLHSHPELAREMGQRGQQRARTEFNAQEHMQRLVQLLAGAG